MESQPQILNSGIILKAFTNEISMHVTKGLIVILGGIMQE